MRTIEFPRLTERRANKLDKIVFSSRVRLTRNLEGLKFPLFLSEKDRFDIEEKISETLKNLPGEVVIEDFDEPARDRIMIYVSTHIITHEFVKNARKLAYASNGDWVILLNEEDHLRIFAIETGYNIRSIYQRLNEILDTLEKSVDFSYDEKYGYLTSSVINMGTGLRLSALVNLYGLMVRKRMNDFIETANSFGYSVTSLAGENSDDGLYYISNIYSLGIPEEEMLTEFDDFMERVFRLEMEAREEFFSLKDERDLSFEEIMELKNKEKIEWDKLLYYISLVDAMNGNLLTLKDPQSLRTLITHSSDDYLIFKQRVAEDKLTRVRMDLIKKLLSRVNYKTSR